LSLRRNREPVERHDEASQHTPTAKVLSFTVLTRWGCGGGKPPPHFLFFAWYGRLCRPYQAKRRYLGGPLALQTSHQSADCVSPVIYNIALAKPPGHIGFGLRLTWVCENLGGIADLDDMTGPILSIHRHHHCGVASARSLLHIVGYDQD